MLGSRFADIQTNAPLSPVALIQSPKTPSIMDTEYLVRLAHQLRIDKTPACRRAINRILEDMKKRCENGEYRNPKEAESAFRKFVDDERSCKKTKAV
jgi:hypothetical protein